MVAGLVTRRLLAAAVGLLVALHPTSAPAAPTTTLGPPRRIVSTSPSITETVFALGLGDRVVGVSQYCRYPPEVRALPKVGSFLKPDAEAIARLAPDLVLLHTKADGLEGRLAAVGLHVAAVDRGEALADVFASIAAIAEATRVPERGRTLVDDIQKRLARMRNAARREPRTTVLLIVGRRPGTLSDIVGVGPRTYLGELLEIAGGTNVLVDATAYPHLSLETVIRLRPDVIIDTGDMGDTPGEREASGRANLALWHDSPLVRAAGLKRIHAATTDALVVPGPRVVEAAEWLRRLIGDDRMP